MSTPKHTPRRGECGGAVEAAGAQRPHQHGATAALREERRERDERNPAGFARGCPAKRGRGNRRSGGGAPYPRDPGSPTHNESRRREPGHARQAHEKKPSPKPKITITSVHLFAKVDFCELDTRRGSICRGSTLAKRGALSSTQRGVVQCAEPEIHAALFLYRVSWFPASTETSEKGKMLWISWKTSNKCSIM